jgi:hypothetical protein
MVAATEEYLPGIPIRNLIVQILRRTLTSSVEINSARDHVDSCSRNVTMMLLLEISRHRASGLVRARQFNLMDQNR